MQRFAALALGFVLICATVTTAGADQTEDQIGAQVYQQLTQKGEIINSSPYYNALNLIATRIKAVADREYDRPFGSSPFTKPSRTRWSPAATSTLLTP